MCQELAEGLRLENRFWELGWGFLQLGWSQQWLGLQLLLVPLLCLVWVL